MDTEQMDLAAAIDRRVSCRAYEQRPLMAGMLAVLRAEAEAACLATGLHFELHVPEQDGSRLALSPRMFAGEPAAYVTCVGPSDPVSLEKIGYYGERLVLLATTLGLGSCWVAGTFDRKQTTCEVPEGEALHDVIPLGIAMKEVPFKQRSIRKAIRAKSKRQAKLYVGPTGLAEAPAWVQKGIDAVWKGPSAVNEQPVVFEQETYGAPLRAALPRVRRDMVYTDLGIAKLHFELAASAAGAPGAWEWGAGGIYKLA